MVEISIEYQGGLRTVATHGPSQSELTTDAPVDNHGRGEAFSPTDLVATALGTCMATTMGIVADRKSIDLTGMKVHVKKHMSQDAPRRISRLEVEISLPFAAGHPEQKLLESAALACPVHRSLHPDVEVPIHFHYS